jgi:16S rRNA G966 N2-methylase RsmD
VSVEKANRHSRMIRDNLEAAGLDQEKFELRCQDAFVAIGQLAAAERAFDLVIADPPFGEKNVGRRSDSFSQRLLDDETLPGLISSEGLLVLGHTKRDQLSVPPFWEEIKVMKHGDSMFRFLAVAKQQRE